MSSLWKCSVTVNDIFVMSLFDLVSQETRSTSIFQSSCVMLLQSLLTIFNIIEIHMWLCMFWLFRDIFFKWSVEDHNVLLKFHLLRWRLYSCFMLFNSTRWISMWVNNIVFIQWRIVILWFETWYCYWIIKSWSWNVRFIWSWHRHVIFLSLHLVIRLSSLWIQWFRILIILCKDHLSLICHSYTYFNDLL